LTNFMKSRTGAEKVLFGSNGLSWKRYNEQIAEMGLREDSLEKILYGNAQRIFKL